MSKSDHMVRFVALLAIALVSGSTTVAVEPATVFKDAIAYWNMASPDDSAGINSHLQVIGTGAEFGVKLPDVDRASSLASGGDGVALRLDNSTLTAGQGDHGELNIAGDKVTVLLRLKNSAPNWDLTLLAKHGGHDKLQYNLYAFDDPTSAKLGFEFYTPSGYQGWRDLVPNLKDGQWHTLVGRYDGRLLNVFVDGQCVGSQPANGPLRGGSDQPLTIGGEQTQKGEVIRRFTGLIDHAAIWARSLTDVEIQSLSGISPAKAYSEPWRPQYHFTPPQNWINDPNGLLYVNGKYHLFYQYNPFGNRWGHMSWGHAVSADLLHWEHLPLALPEDKGVMIWSGSAVYDKNNTSGFGTKEKGPLVAIYTARAEGPPERQAQAIAYSCDDGGTWTKYAGNPVIDLDTDAFRDPKVFWYAPQQKWVMVVSLPKKAKVLFYESKNLKNWNLMSEFGPAGVSDSGLWECPELIELPVDGNPKNTRWVLQISIGKTISGGTGGMYFVGRFDGSKFENETPPNVPLWVDYGRDFYALQAFNGLDVAGQNRRVWIGWLNNWAYANEIPTGRWRGAMSIPREVALVTSADGIRLTQQPIRELASLRGKPIEVKNQTVASDHDPLKIVNFSGTSYEIAATFRLGTARRFGLRLLAGEGEYTEVGYDQRLDELYINRRHAGEDKFTRDFGDHQHAPFSPDANNRVTMRILVDRSVVEVFSRNGLVTITDQVFPKLSSTGLSPFTDSGEVLLESLTIYPLKGVWKLPAE